MMNQPLLSSLNPLHATHLNPDESDLLLETELGSCLYEAEVHLATQQDDSFDLVRFGHFINQDRLKRRS